jgi:hypothetical protein
MKYLESAKRQFLMYKGLGEKAMGQISDDCLDRQPDTESNSIATIVKHLWGNMLSRWTDFRTTDGEKEWRNRDAEFETDSAGRAQVLQRWNEGWDCLFAALNSITDDDLEQIIYIRGEQHTILEAINRQIAHYAYHVGQIVYIARMYAHGWESLSIPRNKSAAYNAALFAENSAENKQ